MNNKIVFHNQDGDPTLEPLTSILINHPAAFSNVTPRNEQRVRIRLSERVADEGLRNVAHQDGLFPPHTMRADSARLGVSEDNAHRHAQHSGATGEPPRGALQQAMPVLAERPIAVKRQREPQIVAEELRETPLADELEVLRVGEEPAERREEDGGDGRGFEDGEQLAADLEVGVVAGGEDGRLQRAADLQHAVGEGELPAGEHRGDQQREGGRDRDGLRQHHVALATPHAAAAAYVIFGVSVGILLALVLMLSSCMSTLSDVALRRAERSGDAWGYDYDYQYYYDDQFEGYPDDGLELLEDLYTDYFVDPVTNA